MSGKISATQCLALANEYGQFGDALADYQNLHYRDPDVDRDALSSAIEQVGTMEINYANQAAAIVFNDAAATYDKLNDVQKKAKDALVALTALKKAYERVANLFGGMIDLGLALGSRNAGAVGKAIGEIATAVKGSSPKQTGAASKSALRMTEAEILDLAGLRARRRVTSRKA